MGRAHASRVISFGGAFSLLRRVTLTLRDDRINAYAAESAFFMALSAIPLLTLTVTAARLFITEPVYDYMSRLAELVPGIIGEYIESEFLSFAEYPTPAPLSVSALTLVWGASRGVRAVRRGVRSVYGETGGSAVGEIIKGLAFTLAFILIIVSVLVFFVFGEALSEMAGEDTAAAAIFDAASALSPVLSLFSLTAFFTVTLRTFTPHGDEGRRLAIYFPGAAFAASGWTLSSCIFSVFVSDFSDMPHIYGSLAAIAVLMLWLYMIMYILLLGAEVNKALARRHKKK